MPDRVASDHPSVATVRAAVERVGGPRQFGVGLPADALEVPTGEVVRVVIDGRERFATFERRGDRLVVPGAYGTPGGAREPGGHDDHLRAWLRGADIDVGRSVCLDVVVPGFRYGLRRPGDSAVYDTSRPPSDGLRDIAADLEE